MRLADNKPILHKLSNVLPRVRHRYFANLWAVVRNGVRNPKSKAEALRLEGEGVWQAIRSSHAKDIDARHHHAHRKKYILAVSYAAARRQHHTVRSRSRKAVRRWVRMSESRTSLGSIHIFRVPHLRTEAARRFWSLSDTIFQRKADLADSYLVVICSFSPTSLFFREIHISEHKKRLHLKFCNIYDDILNFKQQDIFLSIY